MDQAKPSLPSFQHQRSGSFNRSSFSGMTFSFTVEALKDLLLKLVPICQGVDRFCCQHVMGLVWEQKVEHLSNEDIEEISCFLEGFLSPSYEHISKTLLVDIHSCMGLIREQQGLFDRAIRSLLLALWLQQKVSANPVALAVTEHRLGLVYAKTGEYKKAIYLLEKAINAYTDSKMKTRHNCVVEAEQALAHIRISKLESELDMHGSSSTNLCDTCILEDAEIKSCNQTGLPEKEGQLNQPSRAQTTRQNSFKKRILRARSA